jgi:hypothetical protein
VEVCGSPDSVHATSTDGATAPVVPAASGGLTMLPQQNSGMMRTLSARRFIWATLHGSPSTLPGIGNEPKRRWPGPFGNDAMRLSWSLSAASRNGFSMATMSPLQLAPLPLPHSEPPLLVHTSRILATMIFSQHITTPLPGRHIRCLLAINTKLQLQQREVWDLLTQCMRPARTAPLHQAFPQ